MEENTHLTSQLGTKSVQNFVLQNTCGGTVLAQGSNHGVLQISAGSSYFLHIPVPQGCRQSASSRYTQCVCISMRSFCTSRVSSLSALIFFSLLPCQQRVWLKRASERVGYRSVFVAIAPFSPAEQQHTSFPRAKPIASPVCNQADQNGIVMIGLQTIFHLIRSP